MVSFENTRRPKRSLGCLHKDNHITPATLSLYALRWQELTDVNLMFFCCVAQKSLLPWLLAQGFFCVFYRFIKL